ncbi:GntR family transcriptional regulator [Phytoactinopolyspora limicola]|uniref:GntR family transcriptional regulator n=1 Tax=Phytoactinopolyspora limicola TaxID=2715536 RepID=UPI00140D55F3|nr:GntR family transcriptional regulator [Phytoactinopolyspora limicola]
MHSADNSHDSFQIQQPPTLREQVYEKLEVLIITGRLEPGQRLIETDLATRLGVSRGPVREALQALGKAGWVDVRPHYGAYVHKPSIDEVEEFFDFRLMLEVEAARLAARRADQAAVDELRGLVRRGHEALGEHDEDGIISANWHFHQHIANLTGNRFLGLALDGMNKKLRWYFRPVAMVRAPESLKEHEEFVEALHARDTDLAVEVTRRHIDQTRHRYLDTWPGALAGS